MLDTVERDDLFTHTLNVQLVGADPVEYVFVSELLSDVLNRRLRAIWYVSLSDWLPKKPTGITG